MPGDCCEEVRGLCFAEGFELGWERYAGRWLRETVPVVRRVCEHGWDYTGAQWESQTGGERRRRRSWSTELHSIEQWGPFGGVDGREERVCGGGALAQRPLVGAIVHVLHPAH